MTPRPGDYFVTATSGSLRDRLLSWLIRYGTDAPVNHAGIYVGIVPGYTVPQVIEGRPGGAGYRDVTAYPDAIYSAFPLSDQERASIVAAAGIMLGTPYGVLDIIAIALAQRRAGSIVKVHRDLADQPWWVRRIASMRTLICSQLVDDAYTATGIRLFPDGRLPGLVSPGDLFRRLYGGELMRARGGRVG